MGNDHKRRHARSEWLETGQRPPSSQVPTIGDGALVASDQASTGFPQIPRVTYGGLANSGPLLDFGPGFNRDDERGVISTEPPRVLGQYRVLVPRTDADGNDVGPRRWPHRWPPTPPTRNLKPGSRALSPRLF